MNPSSEQVQNNGGEDGKDRNILDSLPTGMVFAPTDDELIVYYLMNKIQNQPLPPNKIEVVNIYAFDPDQLPGMYKPLGRHEWFFFTPRERRYQKGSRPKRTAGDGHWKATGADKPVKLEDQTVGYRKALVYYRGEHKTNWIMHEYKAARPGPNPSRTGVNDETFDDIVLCRIYNKGGLGEGLKRPRYEPPRNDEIPRQQPVFQKLHGSASSVLPHKKHQVFSNPIGAINQLASGEHESSPLQHQQHQQPIVQNLHGSASSVLPHNKHQVFSNPITAINQLASGEHESSPLQHQQQQQPIAQNLHGSAPSVLPHNKHQVFSNPIRAINQLASGEHKSSLLQHQQQQQPIVQNLDRSASYVLPHNKHQVFSNPIGAINQLASSEHESSPLQHQQQQPVMKVPGYPNSLIPQNNLQHQHPIVEVPKCANAPIRQNTQQLWQNPNGAIKQFMYGGQSYPLQHQQPAMDQAPEYANALTRQNTHQLPLNPNYRATNQFMIGDQVFKHQQPDPINVLYPENANAVFPENSLQVDHLPQAGANVSFPNNNSKPMEPSEFSFMNDDEWDCIYNDFQFNSYIVDDACFGPAMGLNPDCSMGLPSISDFNANLGSTANFNLEYDMPEDSFNQIPNNKYLLPWF